MFSHPEDLLGKPGHVWHGVAVGWRNDINAYVSPIESSCDRISGVKMSLNENSLLLLSYYAPTAGQDCDFIDSICSLSELLLQHLLPGDQIMIGADSNCSSKSSLRRQEAWNNFCKRYQLTNHLSPDPSFHHHNGQSESFIDMFTASSNISTSEIRQYCTLNNHLNLSSHDPIETSISISLETHGKSSNYTSTYLDFKREKIIWQDDKIPKYQELTAKALGGALDYWDSPETLPLLSSLVSNLLVRCATMVFKSRSPNFEKSPKRPSLKLRQAQNVLKRCFEQWKKAGKPDSKADPSRAEYTAARADLQRLSRYEENLNKI